MRGVNVGYPEVQNMIEQWRRDHAALATDFDVTQADPEGLLQYITPGWDYSHTQNGVTPLASPANTVSCYQFQLSQNVKTLGALSCFAVSGLSAGPTAVFGIYNVAGDELLCEWRIPIASATLGLRIGDPELTISLDAGTYWLAWSCDTNVPVLQGIGGSVAFGAIMNVLTPLLATSSNLMSSLELPSSLGTLTALDTLVIPVICIDIES